MRFLFAATLAAVFTLSWSAPSLADLCYDYVEARQYDEAIEQCTKQYENAQTNHNRAIILNNRGNAYYQKVQYDRAIEDCNKVIQFAPNDASAYYNIACLYSVQNNTVEACEWLKKAVEKGYDKWTHIKANKDLNNIRNSACYIEIMAGKGEPDAHEMPSPDDLTKRHD